MVFHKGLPAEQVFEKKNIYCPTGILVTDYDCGLEEAALILKRLKCIIYYLIGNKKIWNGKK